jgi:hypothetical protein
MRRGDAMTERTILWLLSKLDLEAILRAILPALLERLGKWMLEEVASLRAKAAPAPAPAPALVDDEKEEIDGSPPGK